jgi:hypothetical protein
MNSQRAGKQFFRLTTWSEAMEKNNFPWSFAILMVLALAGMAFGVDPSTTAGADSPSTQCSSFQGFCEIGEPSDLGGDVRVQVTLRILNHSRADVVGAIITLKALLRPDGTYGTFSPVDVRDKEGLRLGGCFIVPRRDRKEWEEGASPKLRTDFLDSAGNQAQRGIELVLVPVSEEEEPCVA